MLKINKLPLLVVSVFGYLTIVWTFFGSVTPTYGQDKESGIPSIGSGAYEIIMFTDYFCNPCYRIDTKAEVLMKELLASGKTKITFIDVPINSATPIYARYYLYAINSGVDDEKVFRIRKTLFKAAQVGMIKKKEKLTYYLKREKIDWKEFDEKPIFVLMANIIKDNNVDSTPTCVIKYSPTEIKKYIGTDEIWDGLTKLKSHLAADRK